VTKKKILS